MIPPTFGFLVIAPLSGCRSDRHRARKLAAAGMAVTAAGFVGVTLIPAGVLDSVSESTRTTILGTRFFPSLLAAPFKDGVTVAFLISAVLSLLAAATSIAGGRGVVRVADPAVQARFPEPRPVRVAPQRSEELPMSRVGNPAVESGNRARVDPA